ncbi:MAG: methyltransferase domain-containing protein [Nitrospiraceae bacterium]|nr:MAG: methyltransferase domain-containing protein [Nitrospiraceae bacterium]
MSGVSGKTAYLKQYYGKVLQGVQDLKTSACCCSEELLHPAIRDIESQLDNEILTKFYGCGSPIPPALAGCVVLDLGCGTGKDVFIASRLTGEKGTVVGVDMTDEQLDVAHRHIDSQMEKFGYNRRNVEFKKGYIEDLREIGIEDNSIDVVMSNCVVNLSSEKEKVFSEIFRVLKPGGELFFSDVFAGRRVPEDVQNDPLLHSECLGGALYIEDFRRLLRETGCLDYRVAAKHKIKIGNPKIEVKVGMVDFYSMTVRAFKLDTLEDICEDYGQVAVYRGTIPGYPHAFELDDHHRFIKGKPMLVCGNTASMLEETRYGKHFTVSGDRSVHYGIFDCAPAHEKRESGDESGGACC